MAGRYAPEQEVTGGFTRLTQAVQSAPLMRYVKEHPGLVSIQLASSVVAETAGFRSNVLADILWGTGNGAQSVTVDVGAGTAFTLTSDHNVDVKVRYGAAVTAGNTVTVDVFGSIGPATAPSPRLPTFTETIDALAAAATAMIDIPIYATECTVFSNVVGGAAEINFSVLTTAFSAANMVIIPGSLPFIIPAFARGMQITNTGGALTRFSFVWGLAL